MKILNVEPLNYSADARQIVQSLGDLDEREMSSAELLASVADYDVLIVRLRHRIDREVIEAGRRLKAICTATTGIDHIDVACARQHGVAVLSLRGETDFLRTIPATCEHTWGLLLALVRHIPQAFQSVRDGAWNRDAFKGHDLAGRRLGILGLGRIGEKVARYGLAFDMTVAAYDPHRSDWVPGVTRCASMAALLAQSDVLSIHVPLNESTQGLVGADELAQLPPGAVVINTARGDVLDEEALVAALQAGHLSGAALDVIRCEREAHERDQSPLLAYARQHDNLIITPHVGGATYESMAMTEVFIARKLRSFLDTLNDSSGTL